MSGTWVVSVLAAAAAAAAVSVAAVLKVQTRDAAAAAVVAAAPFLVRTLALRCPKCYHPSWQLPWLGESLCWHLHCRLLPDCAPWGCVSRARVHGPAAAAAAAAAAA